MSNHIAWHWFECDLPDKWEVTAFTNNAREGKLDFHTREGYQGQVSWRYCKQTPAELRIMTEVYRSEQKKRYPDTFDPHAQINLRHERIGAYTVAWCDDGEVCQASTWIADKNIQIQWLFPSFSKEKLKQEWTTIFESFQRNDGDILKWEMFGLQVSLPSDFILEEFLCYPANVTMHFVNSKRFGIYVRRWGLPEVLLNEESLECFYGTLIHTSGCRLIKTEPEAVYGYQGVHGWFEKRGNIGLDKLSGRWWPGEGLLWMDPQEKRMYAFEQVGPKKHKRLEMNDVLKKH